MHSVLWSCWPDHIIIFSTPIRSRDLKCGPGSTYVTQWAILPADELTDPARAIQKYGTLASKRCWRHGHGCSGGVEGKIMQATVPGNEGGKMQYPAMTVLWPLCDKAGWERKGCSRGDKTRRHNFSY